MLWTGINGNLGEEKQRDGNRSSLFPPAGLALEAELHRRAWEQDGTSVPSPFLLLWAQQPCSGTAPGKRRNTRSSAPLSPLEVGQMPQQDLAELQKAVRSRA